MQNPPGVQRFQNGEIGFVVPDGWVDLSSTSFTFPEAASSLSLDRAPVAPAATLEQCEADVLAQLAAVFPEMEIVDRCLAQDGVVQLTIERMCDRVTLHHRIALLIADGALWSLAASTPTACLEETSSVIASAMRSFTRAGRRGADR